jgi:hypothetical protein
MIQNSSKNDLILFDNVYYQMKKLVKTAFKQNIRENNKHNNKEILSENNIPVIVTQNKTPNIIYNVEYLPPKLSQYSDSPEFYGLSSIDMTRAIDKIIDKPNILIKQEKEDNEINLLIKNNIDKFCGNKQDVYMLFHDKMYRFLTSNNINVSVKQIFELFNFQYTNIIINIYKNINDKLIEKRDEKTIDYFSCISLPDYQFKDYFFRLIRFCHVNLETLVLSYIYLGMLDFNSYNVHRLYLLCLVFAKKFNEDFVFNNKYYSKIGGISLNELNGLELRFSELLNFDFFISYDILYSVYVHLLSDE